MDLPANIPQRTSAYWLTWMSTTIPLVVKRLRSSVSALIKFMMKLSIKILRTFQFHISTIWELRRATKNSGEPLKKQNQKSVYHINAVDELTEFEVVCSVEKISEAFLIPILKQLLDKFPFKIISFHSDNGSEYINRYVAKLLEKLRIEFTKSRSRQTTENLSG